jgi:hypothetical protein
MDRSVSESALVRRIKRVLRHEGKALRKVSRRTRNYMDGQYHVWTTHNNIVVDSFNDLESYGRKVGALHELETLRVD